MKKILLIEDDRDLNAGLACDLKLEHYKVRTAFTMGEGIQIFQNEDVDLVLLDGNLPDGDGFAFCRAVKAQSGIPVIFLTARDMEQDEMRGFDCGADDYITKPFSIRVLMEKIQAVLRRCGGTQKPQPYACGNLVIDFENRLVKSRGGTVALTPTEFEILETLCRSRGQILTKDVLLEKIWDRKENYVSEHALSLNISRLRSKIADGEYEYIRTVYGLGYQWTGGQK